MCLYHHIRANGPCDEGTQGVPPDPSSGAPNPKTYRSYLFGFWGSKRLDTFSDYTKPFGGTVYSMTCVRTTLALLLCFSRPS
jgi:hypothetical protein